MPNQQPDITEKDFLKLDPVAIVNILVDIAVNQSHAKTVRIFVDSTSTGIIVIRDDGEGIEEKSRNSYFGSEEIEDARSLLHEKLLSIVPACRLIRIATRSVDDMSGEHWNINQKGISQRVGKIGMQNGTIITICDLFQRHPAKKYIMNCQSKKTLQQLRRLIFRFRKDNPGVIFNLKIGGRLN